MELYRKQLNPEQRDRLVELSPLTRNRYLLASANKLYAIKILAGAVTGVLFGKGISLAAKLSYQQSRSLMLILSLAGATFAYLDTVAKENRAHDWVIAGFQAFDGARQQRQEKGSRSPRQELLDDIFAQLQANNAKTLAKAKQLVKDTDAVRLKANTEALRPWIVQEEERLAFQEFEILESNFPN